MSRLFGTDGIRGVANEAPLTPDLAYRVGRELAATLEAQHGDKGVRVVIGRDTRRRGPLLEAAMVAGLPCATVRKGFSSRVFRQASIASGTGAGCVEM